MGYLELTTETTVRSARTSDGIEEHGVFVLLYRWEPIEKLLLDVHMASAALASPAAFGGDAVDPVLDGAFHDGISNSHIDSSSDIVMRDVGHSHGLFGLSSEHNNHLYGTNTR